MSIRLRLTLLYTALVVAVILAFGATLYVGHSRQTRGMVERGIIAAARRMAEPHAWGRGGPAPGPPHPRMPAAYFQTRLPDGTVIDRSESLGEVELPLDAAGTAAVQSGEQWAQAVTVADERLLVVSAPVWQGGELVGIVQVAGSLEMVDAYLGGLRNNLIVITLAAVAVSLVGGWFLAGAVLHPIERITTTAQAIGAGRDFGRRVEHSGPDDELGRLTRTFNEMLSELQEAYLGLDRSLQQQRRFVSDASHELRTPLTTVRGNAELLLREPPINAADRRAVVGDIIAETERLITLVNELLTLARADAGRQLAREPVALRPLLADLERQVRLMAPDRRIAFATPAELAVVGNRGALQQILLNLVENALQHTPPTAGISVSAAPAGDGRVALTVRDTGPGIGAEDLPHVFERFRRGAAARAGSGTGLGLSIAQALTEAQGGAIEVASEVGVGTSFTVTLEQAPAVPTPT